MAIRCGLTQLGAHDVFYSQSSNAFNILPRFPDNVLAFTIRVVVPWTVTDSKLNISKSISSKRSDDLYDDSAHLKSEKRVVPNCDIPPLPDYLYDSYRNEASSPYPITSYWYNPHFFVWTLNGDNTL